MRALLLTAVIACGGASASPRPLVIYRNAADAFELRLSADGSMAAMKTFLVDGSKYELRLWQRGADEKMVGRGPGTIVGVPSDRDVLVIDDDNHVRWLRDDRKATLDLPRGAEWRYVGATTDHDTYTAVLAFATTTKPSGMVLVELDTAAMHQGRQRILRASNTDSCGARGRGTTLYVWCLDPARAPKDRLRWNVSRYDGITEKWSTDIDLPQYSGSDVRGEVTGDGSAFVLLDGLRETSRMRFLAWRVFVLAASDGRIREIQTDDSFGFVDDLAPVPDRPAVAYVRWVYSDFNGIVVLDTQAMTMRVAVKPDGKLAPTALAVQADGRFVIPGH